VKIASADASKPEVAAAASADDREAHERAMKEVQSRIKELEKSAADLTKLIEARSLQIAELEKRAAETRPAPALAPVAKPAVEAPKPALEAPKPALEAPKPAIEAPKPAPGPKPAAKPRPAPPPPAPEPNLIDEYFGDPLMLGGLGGLMLLLVGYGAYAWRKKKRAALSLLGDSLPAMAAARASGPSIAAAAEAKGVAGTAADGEELDPVAEAEVYMAYGRDGQAEEILRTALQKGAGRPIVHLKLLSIYANRRDTEQFEAEARKLKGLVNGEGPEWDKALALGRSIDPGNELYGQGEAAEVAPASALPTLDIDLGGTTSEEPVAAKAAAAAKVAAAAAGELDLSTISFDLDEPKSPDTTAGGRDAKWKKVAVKLDMADAYKEIGDHDGARELLNEALEEGDAAQQAQARQMLASLG
jgi:pilus assembly protein FimV